MSLYTVNKTRKDHICERCGEIISKGERAEYRNLFTGKRGYYHGSIHICTENFKKRRVAYKPNRLNPEKKDGNELHTAESG